jgi:hypothetical protein
MKEILSTHKRIELAQGVAKLKLMKYMFMNVAPDHESNHDHGENSDHKMRFRYSFQRLISLFIIFHVPYHHGSSSQRGYTYAHDYLITCMDIIMNFHDRSSRLDAAAH